MAQPSEPPAPTPRAPVVTLPVVVRDDGAAYPAQALADGVRQSVTVVVVVEIDATGAVKKAAVQAPAGHGFDEAAVAAALNLQYEPAKRDGVPIAAKFLHKYVFTPPLSRVVGRIATDRGGQDAPLEGALVVVESDAGGGFRAVTAADGSFQVADLPAGAYRITVKADGYVAQSYDQSFEPGEEAKVAVRLTPEAAPEPVAPKRGEPIVDEVQVRGTRPPREIVKRTLEQRELSRIPGTNGDALRAIQNLPGVARPPAIAGLLIVRGAAPNETNVYVDGTLVPIVYHFGGLSSVIPTEMIDKLDFYPGNFSAYYGRVTGAIVDVGVKDPKVRADRRIHGLAQADLIDARVLAEGPIFDTGWKFSVAGRRSYVDAWLKPVLTNAGTGVTTAPVYYDYQAMLQRDFGGKH